MRVIAPMAARCYSQRKAGGWVADRVQEIAAAERLARRAAEVGPDDALALCTAGLALGYVVGDLDDGAALTDWAIVLNPNLAWAWLFSGWMKVLLGEPEVAIERVARAMRLSPQDVQFFNMQAATAGAHFVACNYVEALTWAEAAVRGRPHYILPNSIIAASAALVGRPAEAYKAAARLRQLGAASRVSDLVDLFPLRRPEDVARWVDGLRRAGLSE